MADFIDARRRPLDRAPSRASVAPVPGKRTLVEDAFSTAEHDAAGGSRPLETPVRSLVAAARFEPPPTVSPPAAVPRNAHGLPFLQLGGVASAGRAAPTTSTAGAAPRPAMTGAPPAVQAKPAVQADIEGAHAVDTANGTLPPALAVEMGRSFDADFSSVRVIEGSHVSDVGARAFARGNALHFSPGEYRPDTHEGRELIGHELAHLVQQSHGRVSAPAQGKDAGFNTDMALEREANDWGARAARGESLAVGGGARPHSTPGEVAQGYFAVMHDHKRKRATLLEIATTRRSLCNELKDDPDLLRKVLEWFDHAISERYYRGLLINALANARKHVQKSGKPSSRRQYLQSTEERDPSPVATETKIDDANDSAPTDESPVAAGSLPDGEADSTSEDQALPVAGRITDLRPDEVGPSSEEDGNTSLGDHQEPRPAITIRQFGGGTGSRAGDAAVVRFMGSRRLHAIDAGQAGSQQNLSARSARKAARLAADELDSEHSDWETDGEAETEAKSKRAFTKRGSKKERSKRKRSLLITHDHADHVGTETDHSEFGQIFVGGSGPEPRGAKVLSNDSQLFAYRQKQRRLSVTGRAIVPLPPAKGGRVDNNAYSLGELIQVRSEQGGFTFLTLGDMTNNEGLTQVNAALDRDSPAVDVLKMPHHGSEHNLGAVPPEAIGNMTTILISGYTLTDTARLAKFLIDAGRGPSDGDGEKEAKKGGSDGGTYILFQSLADSRKLTSFAVWKCLDALKVKIAKDYVIEIDTHGNVKRRAIEL